VYAGGNEIVAELAEDVGLDAARCIDRRNEVRKDAVKAGHDIFRLYRLDRGVSLRWP
jgi:hypothetical protein